MWWKQLLIVIVGTCLGAGGGCAVRPPEREAATEISASSSAETAYLVGDYKRAIELWTAAAELGKPEAEYNLGAAYHSGRGVQRDEQMALQWFTRSAQRGFAPAMFRRGVYLVESHPPASPLGQEGLKLIEEAARKHSAPAQFWICRSSNTAAEYKAAVHWCTVAAEQGHVRAQYELSLMFADGKGVERDSKRALHWALESAEGGLRRALDRIGTIGGKEAESAMVSSYRSRAEQGDPRGQALYGTVQYIGIGGVIDRNQGVKWWSRAARAGDPVAASELGFAYHSGDGVARNNLEAFVWSSLAAAWFDEVNQESIDAALSIRDKSAELLNPNELAIAQSRVSKLASSLH